MSEKAPLRVVITGAAGQIAYSLIYQVASGYVFGPDQVRSELDGQLYCPQLDLSLASGSAFTGHHPHDGSPQWSGHGDPGLRHAPRQGDRRHRRPQRSL